VSKREQIEWNSGLRLDAGPDFLGRALAAVADIAIVVDDAGIVQTITTNDANRSLGCLDHWIGRDLRDFLTEECLPKLDSFLAALRSKPDQPGKRVQLNHEDNATWEYPIDYVGLATGDGNVLLIGRDLRPIAEVQQQLVKAQAALERDYEMYREFDTRYRILIDASRDAFVFVDAGSGRIEDANAAAATLLGAEVDELRGGALSQEFEDNRRSDFLSALNTHVTAKAASPLVMTARRTGALVRLFPSVFRAGGRITLLCRLEADARSEAPVAELTRGLQALYMRTRDAVVFTDERGMIRAANESFLNLCDLVDLASIKGRSLAEFLARGEVDLKILLDAASRSGRMRFFATRFRTSLGAPRPAELSVTRLGDDGSFGFVAREAARPEQATGAAAAQAAADTSGVGELVGSTPLKDIVAATTDVIERICIETAVEMTGNNRVAAAEMLGVSRQSLYVKLRKYNLIGAGAG
jgi:transcriptional regulator PpsR